MTIVTLLLGLLAILLGANLLTDGAASLAKRLKVSNLVIGLTVVAFGTSAPELSVSLLSALNGNAEMALGNVVGSNLFNTLLIIGGVALIAPITIEKLSIRKEIPLCILASLALLVAANDIFLTDGATVNYISRTEGLLLLGFLAVFISHTFTIAHAKGSTPLEEEPPIKEMPIWKALSFLLIGLVALVGGGQWFVESASAIARYWGVSDSTIGLTLVAGGTSLPELATSLVAAKKKNPQLAIGNAIGSNLFNIFLVLGSCATITPLSIGSISNFDLLSLVASSLLLWVFAIFFKTRTITRLEGIFMILCYFVYMAILVFI